jgi:hypothetical protein
MSKELILTKGKVAVVDDADFEWLSQWKWTYLPSKNDRGYAYRRKRVDGRNTCIYLHRFIMETPEGMDTDHKNGNPLDNRRVNLRICTTAENLANRGPLLTRNKSGYRGVCLQRNKWIAQIGYRRADGRTNIVLGRFNTPEEAARAYDKELHAKFGEFAKLNFKIGG